ncbi:MAG: hypothetical protein LJE59_16475 [Chromatiaceae bacterium]|nr:hypothetical protein [Chromatiaceae bacterium]
MCCWHKGICWLLLIGVVGARPALAEREPYVPLAERSRQLLDTIDPGRLVANADDEHLLAGPNLHIRQCDGYPYNEVADSGNGSRTLVGDLRDGLQRGLECLAGNGPMGRLHPYHEYQAHRLVSLFEDPQAKTFACVADAMFATAVATSPRGVSIDDPLFAQLHLVSYPAVVIDTYRLGGILSRQHDDETYRAFFHLADEQILEHRNGQPLRPAKLHRYRNRSGLIFHELIHWLGHEHSAIYPDLTHLYETCCFGGSDFISDPGRNAAYQQVACNILKDDQLWSNGYKPYKQMRLWHDKGYDTLKAQMRADFDS